MSRFDVSDFDADELNQGIDDTNFPNSRHASISIAPNETHNNDDDLSNIKKSLPMAVKPNGFAKSFDDDVFDVLGTPKTPRSLPTPGNCEFNPVFPILMELATKHTHTHNTQESKTLPKADLLKVSAMTNCDDDAGVAIRARVVKVSFCSSLVKFLGARSKCYQYTLINYINAWTA